MAKYKHLSKEDKSEFDNYLRENSGDKFGDLIQLYRIICGNLIVDTFLKSGISRPQVIQTLRNNLPKILDED